MLLYYIFLALFIYLFVCVLYLLILSIAGHFYKPKIFTTAPQPVNRIALLVPAYKEDNIIISSVRNFLAVDYPESMYSVFVIADSFREETLAQLQELRVTVIPVAFEKSTKTKSLNAAFDTITEEFDIAIICDADNILAKNFLKLIDTGFQAGYTAIQGNRVAKNLDTSFAILDASSEGINNHIFRKGLNALGLSCAVIGSGMAFRFLQLKRILKGIAATGGFDKVLQLQLVQEKEFIRFMSTAIVFDEKIDSSNGFYQQRKRWVSSQFIYLKKYFLSSIAELFRGNLSYFCLGILNNIVLPRGVMLGSLPLLVIAAFFISPAWVFASAALLLLFMLSLMIALPKAMLGKRLFMALLKLPKAVLMMLGTLLHIKTANKTFIHTVHTKTDVDNPIFNEEK